MNKNTKPTGSKTGNISPIGPGQVNKKSPRKATKTPPMNKNENNSMNTENHIEQVNGAEVGSKLRPATTERPLTAAAKSVDRQAILERWAALQTIESLTHKHRKALLLAHRAFTGKGPPRTAQDTLDEHDEVIGLNQRLTWFLNDTRLLELSRPELGEARYQEARAEFLTIPASTPAERTRQTEAFLSGEAEHPLTDNEIERMLVLRKYQVASWADDISLPSLLRLTHPRAVTYLTTRIIDGGVLCEIRKGLVHIRSMDVLSRVDKQRYLQELAAIVGEDPQVSL